MRRNSPLKKELKMDGKRWSEIATKVIAHLIAQKGITLSYNSKRDLKDLSKKLDIPLEELQNFAKPFIQKMVDEVYGKPLGVEHI